VLRNFCDGQPSCPNIIALSPFQSAQSLLVQLAGGHCHPGDGKWRSISGTELRRGAPCVRPHFWHRNEVTVLARGVDGCMSVVTVTITEAQFSQTGAGKLRAMQVIGSTDISESKQHCQNTQATTRTRVAMFHPSSSTFHRPQTVEGRGHPIVPLTPAA
jgi:hypothetical protein